MPVRFRTVITKDKCHIVSQTLSCSIMIWNTWIFVRNVPWNAVWIGSSLLYVQSHTNWHSLDDTFSQAQLCQDGSDITRSEIPMGLSLKISCFSWSFKPWTSHLLHKAWLSLSRDGMWRFSRLFISPAEICPSLFALREQIRALIPRGAMARKQKQGWAEEIFTDLLTAGNTIDNKHTYQLLKHFVVDIRLHSSVTW